MNTELRKAGTSLIAVLVLLLAALVTPSSVHAQESTMHPDARPLPPHIQELKSESVTAAGAGITDAPGYYDTSVFMTGSVVVGIVLPESTGSGENWTTTEKNNVVQEIQSGMSWWVTKGGTLASLSFQYDIQNVSTTYEPITLGTSSEGLWIGQSMANLGYSSGDYFERVYAYTNHIRDQYHTDWAFTIFVIDSSNDVDGMFSDGYFGYAYLSGPFIVMTYDNDGWGISNMSLVASHETGHIFLAGDQYYQAGYGGCTSLTQKYGYLGVANSNCQYNNPSSVPSIMRNNEDVVDTTARGQIGWRDTDSDGKPDPMDTLPIITLAQHTPDPTGETSWSYSGNVEIPPYAHASCTSGDACYYRDVTTQTITQIQYRVDSGGWTNATASDGSMNSDIEDFAFSVNGMTPGTHTIQVQAAASSGNISAVWSDSVTVLGPMPVGKYDDANGAWSYSAGWTAYTGNGPYANTMHYTGIVGSYARLSFTGNQFILKLQRNTNRGQIEVYVDDTYLDTINANGTLLWQWTWTSPVLATGDHMVQFVFIGSGTYADIDAIEILGPPPPVTYVGPGIYDDVDSAWSYSAGWTTYTGSGPSANTMHYTNMVGSYAELAFTGNQFTLKLQRNTNRGRIDVYVDSTYLATINAYGTLLWQWTWTSPALTAGDHIVRFVFIGSGTYADIDAIEIPGPPPPVTYVGPGTYDDADSAWSYSAGWTTYTGSGPSANTMHYTNMVGSYAELSFTGQQFTLKLQRNTNRGRIGVYVDGNNIATINAYGTLLWQWTWTSPVLSAGDHTVRFVFIGSGTYVDIDAIEVQGPPPPVGPGTYDDAHSAWGYSAGWTAYTGSGPSANTMHYTSTVGSYAELTFTGNQFVLKLQRNTNRGQIEVYVDSTYLDTINAYGTLLWQWTWTSPELALGDHTVRFVFIGSGTYADIDAIEVLGPRIPVEPGTYDDAHSAWSYSAGWTTYTGSGPSANTMHYTSTPGNVAALAFNGTRFILKLQRNTNRGQIHVFIDNIEAPNYTIDPHGPLLWQWTWTWDGPDLDPGNHVVMFVFAGGGTYMDIDAIEILDIAASTGPSIADCPVFPADNIWNVPINTLPVHSLSSAWIDSIGRDTGFHMDFGSGTWDGGPIGIPYDVTNSSTPKYTLTFYYPTESDAGPYPIPANALIEYGSDHHLLAVDSSTCTLYEVYDITRNTNGSWSGGSGAIWNLNSHALRPAGWTSADAAGLPILPGLVRYEEIQAGAINHALRFTASSTNGYVWPARHLTSDTSNTSIPPMGARFRLRSNYDISGFPAEMQVILRAMKTYGIILADNGSDWYVSGAPNEGWDNDMLHLLDVLTGDDFEAVDVSSLMVNVDSGSTR